MTTFFFLIPPNLSVTKALPIDLSYRVLVSKPSVVFKCIATVINVIKIHNQQLNICSADSGSRTVTGVDLRPFA
jgi:hypothetical protein